MVNPGSEHGEWKVWGLSQGFVPTGPQGRGEEPLSI